MIVSRAERSPRGARAPLPAGFWTLWTTVALDLIGFGIVVPILGQYAERYGASGLTVGLLFAVYSVAQLIGAPLLGRLSDRIGRKPVIVVALVGTAAGSFVTGAAGVLWVLFLGRIIDGASGGSLSVAQAAVADIAPPDERPRLLGLLGAAFGVGFVLGPAIGGLAALGGPRVPFFVAGGLATINAIAAFVRLPETRSDADRHAGGIHVPHAAILRRLAVVGFITVLAFTAFEATFSLFGRRRFHLTEASTSAVFLVIGLVLVVMQAGVYHRLAARTGPGRLYLAAVILIAAGLGLTGAATHWPVLIVALMLLGLGQGLGNPAITTLVTQHASPQRRGEALGFQQSAYAVARILGPPAAGALFDHTGIWSPYVGAAVLCALGAVLVVRWGIDRRPAADAPSDRAAQAV